MTFEVGQIVQLGDEPNAFTQMKARPGAKAKVIELIAGDEAKYVKVEWDKTDPRWREQNDGNYYIHRFVPVAVNIADDGNLLEEILASQELYANLKACG